MLALRRSPLLFVSLFVFTLSIVTLLVFSFYESIHVDKTLITGAIFVGVYLLVLLCLNRSEAALPKALNYLSALHLLGLMAYSYWQYSTIVSPFPDSFAYLKYLQQMMDNDLTTYTEVTGLLGSINVLYPYMNYIVYKIFGDYFALYCTNILISTISIVLLYKVIKIDFSKNVALSTTVFLLVSSNIGLFTSSLLKDALVLFLTVVAIYLYKTNRSFLLVFLVIILLTVTRIYAGVSVISAIFFDVMWFQRKQVEKKRKLRFIFVTLIGLCIAMLMASASRYVTITLEFAGASSILSIIKTVPIAIAKMFFSPFFWNMLNEQSAYTILITDAIMFMSGSFAILSFMAKMVKDRELRKKMYFYLVPLFIYAIALGSAFNGDSARQRIGVFFVIVLVYTVGLFYKRQTNTSQ